MKNTFMMTHYPDAFSELNLHTLYTSGLQIRFLTDCVVVVTLTCTLSCLQEYISHAKIHLIV